MVMELEKCLTETEKVGSIFIRYVSLQHIIKKFSKYLLYLVDLNIDS